MWKVSQILKVRDRSQGMGPDNIYTSDWWRRIYNHKRGLTCHSLTMISTRCWTQRLTPAFTRLPLAALHHSLKQLPHQYLTFLKTTTKTSKRNKNVLREENYSPCCVQPATNLCVSLPKDMSRASRCSTQVLHLHICWSECTTKS